MDVKMMINKSLDEKIAGLVELKKRLGYSLMIQQLWPDAFLAGRCVTRFSGSFHDVRTLKFIIKRGDNTEKEFELIDVPLPLVDRQIDRQIFLHPESKSLWEKARNAIKAMRILSI